MTTTRHVVIGTAGHIDHGKTMLVQALTGKNTDRLREEQERGISIDIDFAPLKFADGTIAGLVDVPGHERFVRNMVAGAAGIDGALIVIDINEGLMPQTYEHLSILRLLGVKPAVIALTKVDLADPELIDIAQDVVRESLAQTPFADAPMVATSVKTGQGLDELRDLLYELVRTCETRDSRGAFRMPVDKVFSIPGFGTVVSGTIWRGGIAVGDTVEVLPQRQEVRVRGIQVHGKSVKASEAGQRTALNLVGIDKSEVRRGYVIATAGTLNETTLMDTRVQVLPGLQQGLHHRQRVHVHLGTAEAVGTVLLLDDDTIQPGHDGYVQIQLDRPLVCDAMDSFIIRRYSPVTTIGGGHVIDPVPQWLHRRKRDHILEMLANRDSDSPQQRLLGLLREGGVKDVHELATSVGLTPAETLELLQSAQDNHEAIELPSGWSDAGYIEDTLTTLEQNLWQLHQKQRFFERVQRTQLLATVDLPLRQRDILWLLEEGVRRGVWHANQTKVQAVGWAVKLNDEEQNMLTGLLERLKAQQLQPVLAEELTSQYPKRDRVALALLQHAAEAGTAVEIAENQWLHTDALTAAIDSLRRLFDEQGPFTVAAARDALVSNRKVTVMLLEFLDDRKVTTRHGDVRSVNGSKKISDVTNS